MATRADFRSTLIKRWSGLEPLLDRGELDNLWANSLRTIKILEEASSEDLKECGVGGGLIIILKAEEKKGLNKIFPLLVCAFRGVQCLDHSIKPPASLLLLIYREYCFKHTMTYLDKACHKKLVCLAKQTFMVLWITDLKIICTRLVYSIFSRPLSEDTIAKECIFVRAKIYHWCWHEKVWSDEQSV